MTDSKKPVLLVLAKPKKKTFWNDESGAVTTDEVVLMGAVVGIALLAMGNFSTGAQFLAQDREETLKGYRGISSSATNDDIVWGGGTGGDETSDDGGSSSDSGGSSSDSGGGSSGGGGSSTETSDSGS